jgi:hypothetical protein
VPERLPFTNHEITNHEFTIHETMTPDRGNKSTGIFQAALEHPTDERPAFVDERCAGDEELRREVRGDAELA